MRFTPTGVGTIETITLIPNALAVHPHGRGDNIAGEVGVPLVVGSPPRAWGQCGSGGWNGSARRFTPTGVGTMRAGGPRDAPPAGSPPRAWGQCAGAERRRCRRRFTPTGVGTIARRAPPAPAPPVHPHGRGDNIAGAVGVPLVVGSPPRAWGQLLGVCRLVVVQRFTPTGVGTMQLERRRA